MKFLFEKVEETTRNPEVLNHNVVTNSFAISSSKQSDNTNKSDNGSTNIDQEIARFFFENQHTLLSRNNDCYPQNEHVQKLQEDLDSLVNGDLVKFFFKLIINII